MMRVTPNEQKKIPIRQRKYKNLPQKATLKPTFQSSNGAKNPIVKDSEEYLQILIKKIYYPKSQADNYKAVLPSLSSSSKVDIQLYALLGLLFKLFVHRWYYRLTDDEEFNQRIIEIVAHVTRNLETRLRDVDLICLMLDDVPLVLNEHLEAYRKIHRELTSAFLPEETIDKAFDRINRHPALNGDPSAETEYLRILSKNALQHLLPHDDLESNLVQEFMKSLLSDLLLKNIVQKITQPYQIFEIISLICEVILNKRGSTEDTEVESKLEAPPKEVSLINKLSSMISRGLDLISKSGGSKDKKKSIPNISGLNIFTFLNNLFQISSVRPVLYAFVKSSTLILSSDTANLVFNNILQNTLIKALAQESLTAMIIQKLRNNLFPDDDVMGPSRIEPDQEEFETIRQATKNNLLEICQKYKILTTLIVANELELDDTLDDFLTTFENRNINKHMIYRLLDLLISRLFPELTL